MKTQTTTPRGADALALDLPRMDETHQEFVPLLGQAARAPNVALVPAWQARVSHTEAHPARKTAGWRREPPTAAARYLRTT
ncbi:MAG: hypothetical protein EOO29_33210, partial [Comamonadaceae bacterium]